MWCIACVLKEQLVVPIGDVRSRESIAVDSSMVVRDEVGGIEALRRTVEMERDTYAERLHEVIVGDAVRDAVDVNTEDVIGVEVLEGDVE